MSSFKRMPSSPLDPATISELRVALSRSVATGDHGDELRVLLARAASEARDKGLQAEQLLVALKEIWFGLPQLAANPADATQTKLLQQLIARCIQEYYAG
jgi:hypothetical protein